MWPSPQFPVDLVTFTEEILNGKLHICAVKGITDTCNSLNTKYKRFKSNPTGNSLIKTSISEKILCVKFNHELSFDQFFKTVCKKSKIKNVSLGRPIYEIREK